MAPKRSCKVVSIGYEGRTIDEFVDDLEKKKVDTLLDVRELPLSRKKGFSKTALGERLRGKGIKYEHLRFAGNPFRDIKDKDIQKCLEQYERHLTENPELVEQTTEHLKAGSCVAMLCYERDHECCHRSVLLDAIEASGWTLTVTRME